MKWEFVFNTNWHDKDTAKRAAISAGYNFMMWQGSVYVIVESQSVHLYWHHQGQHGMKTRQAWLVLVAAIVAGFLTKPFGMWYAVLFASVGAIVIDGLMDWVFGD